MHKYIIFMYNNNTLLRSWTKMTTWQKVKNRELMNDVIIKLTTLTKIFI